MAVINNIKDFIYEFTRQYHFDQMPPEVRARYEDFKKNDDFGGNMKYWKRDLDGKTLPLLHNSKLRKIYDMFQDVFENMDQNKKKFKDNTDVNNFFNNWYGPGKVFGQPKPVAGVDARIEHFVTNVLSSGYENQLTRIFKRYNLVPDDFDYTDFVNDIKAKKYQTNPKLRRTLLDLIDYAQDYSVGAYGPEYWPVGLPQYDITVPATVGGVAATTNANVKDWFTTQYNPGFQFALPALLRQLIDSKKIRDKFSEFDNDKIISSKIEEGFKATDYANKESDDYIEPKYSDQKNFLGRVNEKIDKFTENHIDPWTNVLRGTRRFFTPYAKIVVEACSKAKTKDGKKIKPTDGLQGILDASDEILKKITPKSNNAKSHFKWLSERLKDYSVNMPDAFKGAFKNPKQMRAIVEQIIYDALNTKGDGQADAFAKAKTAMEVLSTMKYGIMHSRTVDALSKESWTLWSDKGLSWNKYEGVKFVTTAFDKTVKFAGLALGRGVAALHNKWFRDNTKFRGKFRKNSEAQKARAKFLEQSAKDKHRTEIHSRNWLSVLATGHGQSGRVIDDAATGPTSLADAKTALAAMTPGTPPYEQLLHDIQRYEFAADEKAKLGTWDKDHQDKYLQLMAYWDMLESFGKSHQFTLAADLMRKKFLKKNAVTGKSKAETVTADFLTKYQQRYAA